MVHNDNSYKSIKYQGYPYNKKSFWVATRYFKTILDLKECSCFDNGPNFCLPGN